MARANLKRLEEGKLYYSISEVCAMTGLEQHVLRYWESEFPQLRPKKNRSGNRAYRSKEIKIIRYIRYLLYDELYTIPGAKKKMAEANMADLDGQMTLIRVPSVAAPSEPFPPASLSRGSGPGEPVEAGEPGEGSTEAAEEFEEGVPSGGYPEASPGPDSAAAEERLRGELLFLRDELKRLLADLSAATGGGIQRRNH